MSVKGYWVIRKLGIQLNGRVFSLSYADGEPLVLTLQVLLLQQLSFPLFITSVFGIHNYSNKDKYYAQNTYNNSQYQREFFKEITSQTDYNNSFADISNSFSNKCCFSIKGITHQNKLYHGIYSLSTGETEHED